jgi:hypothetical protein
MDSHKNINLDWLIDGFSTKFTDFRAFAISTLPKTKPPTPSIGVVGEPLIWIWFELAQTAKRRHVANYANL